MLAMAIGIFREYLGFVQIGQIVSISLNFQSIFTKFGQLGLWYHLKRRVRFRWKICSTHREINFGRGSWQLAFQEISWISSLRASC